MMIGSRSRTSSALALAVAATLLTAAGCSSDKPSSPKQTSGPDPALASAVPQSFKAKGMLSFATDAGYPPNEYVDENQNIVGFDVDLGTAIAAKLGLKAKFTNVDFKNILLGVQGGNYDIGMSSFTDTKDRENQNFDMVTYFTAGTKLMVVKGNPGKLDPQGNSLCGKTVGVEKDTIQEDPDIPNRNKACTAAGLQPIKILAQTTQTQVNNSLQAGQSDAVLADSPVVDYYAKGKIFEAAGAMYDSAPYGIAVSKDNDVLAQSILGALKDLQADGTYHALTTKWGISAGEYTNVGINQAKS